MNRIISGMSVLVCFVGLVSLATTSLISRDAPEASVVLDAAARLGIDGQTLAGIGVTGAGVATVLDNLADRVEQAGYLLALEADLSAATLQIRQANADLRLDRADQAAQAALNAGEAQAAAVRQAMSQAQESLMLALFSGLADPDAVRRMFLDHQGAGRLPVAYRFATGSAEESDRLLWALDLCRLAEARGETPPQTAGAMVSAAHGHVVVQTALHHIAAHAEANRLAIEQWAAR